MTIRKFGLKTFGMALILTAMSTMALADPSFGSAPEIDPGSIAGAVTLLSAGMMMVTGRRRSAK